VEVQPPILLHRRTFLHVTQHVCVCKNAENRQICRVHEQDIKKLKRHSASPLLPGPNRGTALDLLGSLRIIFQIKITLVFTVSASSECLHLVSYSNDLLLSMYGAVAQIFCVCKIQRIRQISRFCGTSKS